MKDAPFAFRYEKAAQAVATVLRNERGQWMDYYRLLKLLYIADREMVKQHGRPIIGGRLVAMPFGPLHATVYELIKGSAHDSPSWAALFAREGYKLRMKKDPGNGSLSKAEVEILSRITDMLGAQGDFEIGEITHGYQEFHKHAPTVTNRGQTIAFADLLDDVGLASAAAEIEADARAQDLADEMFGA